MRCYRARCILEESIIRRTRDNEEEYDTFFDEKNQLINEFNEMVSRAFDIIHNNMNENTRLQDMRDWLLPMLMNGQVSVGD